VGLLGGCCFLNAPQSADEDLGGESGQDPWQREALSILAHKLARAIFYMLKNNVPFDRERFLATA
jgi:hypothetical protein